MGAGYSDFGEGDTDDIYFDENGDNYTYVQQEEPLLQQQQQQQPHAIPAGVQMLGAGKLSIGPKMKGAARDDGRRSRRGKSNPTGKGNERFEMKKRVEDARSKLRNLQTVLRRMAPIQVKVSIPVHYVDGNRNKIKKAAVDDETEVIIKIFRDVGVDYEGDNEDGDFEDLANLLRGMSIADTQRTVPQSKGLDKLLRLIDANNVSIEIVLDPSLETLLTRTDDTTWNFQKVAFINVINGVKRFLRILFDELVDMPHPHPIGASMGTSTFADNGGGGGGGGGGMDTSDGNEGGMNTDSISSYVSDDEEAAPVTNFYEDPRGGHRPSEYYAKFARKKRKKQSGGLTVKIRGANTPLYASIVSNLIRFNIIMALREADLNLDTLNITADSPHFSARLLRVSLLEHEGTRQVLLGDLDEQHRQGPLGDIVGPSEEQYDTLFAEPIFSDDIDVTEDWHRVYLLNWNTVSIGLFSYGEEEFAREIFYLAGRTTDVTISSSDARFIRDFRSEVQGFLTLSNQYGRQPFSDIKVFHLVAGNYHHRNVLTLARLEWIRDALYWYFSNESFGEPWVQRSIGIGVHLRKLDQGVLRHLEPLKKGAYPSNWQVDVTLQRYIAKEKELKEKREIAEERASRIEFGSQDIDDAMDEEFGARVLDYHATATDKIPSIELTQRIAYLMDFMLEVDKSSTNRENDDFVKAVWEVYRLYKDLMKAGNGGHKQAEHKRAMKDNFKGLKKLIELVVKNKYLKKNGTKALKKQVKTDLKNPKTQPAFSSP